MIISNDILHNEEQRQSGYKNGKNDVYNGLIIYKKKKMENLKVKLNKFSDSIPMETNKLRNRNICINIIVFIVFVALFIIFYLLKLEIFIHIITIVFVIIMQLRLIKLFPFDIKECNDIAENMVKCKKEYIEIQSSIRALEIEIDNLEIKKKDID